MMEYQFGLLGIDGSTRLSVRGVRRDPGAACTNVDSAFQPDCLAWMGDMLTDSSKRARYCAALESADARTLCLRRTGYITKLDPSKCADRDACWFGRIVSQGGSKEFEADVLSSCPKAGEPGARGCALAAGYVFEMRTERSRSIDPRCAAAFSHAAQRDTCEDGAVEARTAPLFY